MRTQQIERRAEKLVTFWKVILVDGPISAYAIGQRVGYRPVHAHRWTAPLLRERLIVRRATGFVRSQYAKKLNERAIGERIARAAASSLKGRRRVRASDTVVAQNAVGRLLGVRLYDLPMTTF